MVLFQRMVIAGVGLIGGSLAIAAREAGLVRQVVGYGRREESLQVARERGLIDCFFLDAALAAQGADLLVAAVPVGAIAEVVRRFIPSLPAGCVVTDVGSVKAAVVAAVEPMVAGRVSFVGGHPIAGTEESGPQAALPRLFQGKLCLLTATDRTDRTALKRVRALWEGVGMRVEEMTPDLHDRILALVSHMPHVIAYALVNSVTEARAHGVDPVPYGGGGLSNFTRVAASSEEMWRDICLANTRHVLHALSFFETSLQRLKALIERGDAQGLGEELRRARQLRKDMAGER